MNRYFFIFTFFLFITGIEAQNIEFDENCILFRDYKTKLPVLILKDSILYTGNPLKRKTYHHTNYPDKLWNYQNFEINGKNYLVHNGGGPVLEFRNDSILKINNSKLFENQIGAATFVYKGEIYFFGGYGMFTYKNILTKYDLKNKDWIQVQTFGDKIPNPRSRFYSHLDHENLYIFGGDEEDPDNFPNFKKCDNVVWRLHLPTMQWHRLGSSNLNLLGENTYIHFSANNKLYLISTDEYNKVYEIDIKKNTLKKYTEKILIKPTQIYYDNNNKEMVCVTWGSNGKYKLFKTKLNSFLAKPIYETPFLVPFYEDINVASFGFSFLFLVVIVLLTMYLVKYKKNDLKPFNGIIYKTNTSTLYYKGKSIDTLAEPELRILVYLIKNTSRFISLNELNQLFENSDQKESFGAIVKRRELSMSTLLSKLSLITNIAEKELLINRKNPNDKRIKEIKLDNSFIKIK